MARSATSAVICGEVVTLPVGSMSSRRSVASRRAPSAASWLPQLHGSLNGDVGATWTKMRPPRRGPWRPRSGGRPGCARRWAADASQGDDGGQHHGDQGQQQHRGEPVDAGRGPDGLAHRLLPHQPQPDRGQGREGEPGHDEGEEEQGPDQHHEGPDVGLDDEVGDQPHRFAQDGQRRLAPGQDGLRGGHAAPRAPAATRMTRKARAHAPPSTAVAPPERRSPGGDAQDPEGDQQEAHVGPRQRGRWPRTARRRPTGAAARTRRPRRWPGPR